MPNNVADARCFNVFDFAVFCKHVVYSLQEILRLRGKDLIFAAQHTSNKKGKPVLLDMG
jgi:hypothetical protein